MSDHLVSLLSARLAPVAFAETRLPLSCQLTTHPFPPILGLL